MIRALFKKCKVMPLILAVFALLSVFALQSFSISVHQGHHVAQSLKKNLTQHATLDEGPCDTCIVLSHPSVTPDVTVSPAAPLPLIEMLVSFRPVDPKSNIQRTCDARGPPTLI